MKITVRLFAQLREEAGVGGLELVLEEGSTLADALRSVAEKLPAIKRLVFEADGETLRRTYQLLVSGENTRDMGRRLRDGDTVAIIPPVAGG